MKSDLEKRKRAMKGFKGICYWRHLYEWLFINAMSHIFFRTKIENSFSEFNIYVNFVKQSCDLKLNWFLFGTLKIRKFHIVETLRSGNQTLFCVLKQRTCSTNRITDFYSSIFSDDRLKSPFFCVWKREKPFHTSTVFL